MMRRREFVTLLGGAAAWPIAARAQQLGQVKRVGALMNLSDDDPEGQTRVAVLMEALQRLGWVEGRNIRVEYRWGGNAERVRRGAEELMALTPDVILASGFPSMVALRQATRSLPIVFVLIADPVGAGFVDSLARPGGNVTGFALFEFSISGKWLDLLKRIAPQVTRVGVLRDAALTSGVAYFATLQAVAPSLGVEVSAIGVSDAAEIERGVTTFARSSNCGLIVTPVSFTPSQRNLIITLAARHKLPSIYYERYLIKAGGLASYGPDYFEQYRRAAGYIDRVLRGEKPSDLPVQAPTKYQTLINLKTAKAIGLEIPPTVLAIADEVIE